ncbi:MULTISPECIES: SLC13 family permease [Roseobacteraceae]|uniref:Citrate transporter n=2 Tax=Celeribacter TaxID=875170 RepID=A0A2T5H0N9_9RHOB|nr:MULTISPECIES: SLC13 family permease [Roseobacteraceae]PTQ65136.1 citrate transporter [Celeribacter persicus]
MFLDLGPYEPFGALVLVCGVFALFLIEKIAAEVVALCGVALALLFGLIQTDELLSALSNPAPATIGAMFILSAALVRTGVLDAVTGVLYRGMTRRPRTTITVFFALAALASAFMNNTPVVMMLIPVIFGLARDLETSASRFLIPLSFIVIMGGACSLIGTSTNLLVDGVSQQLGLAPFGLLEIAPLGLCLTVIGGLFLALATPRFLPDRVALSDTRALRAGRSWQVVLFVPHG